MPTQRKSVGYDVEMRVAVSYEADINKKKIACKLACMRTEIKLTNASQENDDHI